MKVTFTPNIISRQDKYLSKALSSDVVNVLLGEVPRLPSLEGGAPEPLHSCHTFLAAGGGGVKSSVHYTTV